MLAMGLNKHFCMKSLSVNDLQFCFSSASKKIKIFQVLIKLQNSGGVADIFSSSEVQSHKLGEKICKRSSKTPALDLEFP